MVSFRARLSAGLSARGIQVCSDLDETPYDAVLVIGGTRDLVGLWRARRRGVPLVQRLDGINWIHRRRRTSWRHYLRAEYGNIILSSIRLRLASSIVYQSEFVRRWWQDWYGKVHSPQRVIYNGVDIKKYSPDGRHNRPAERYRLLVVEGSIAGGYEMGLENALRLAELLVERHGLLVELMIVGRVSSAQRGAWQARSKIPLLWAGVVPLERIPEIDRSAHLLFSADVHSACPNSVIEALACGLPVVTFDTGALSEIVTGDAGRVVPYGGDAWKLEAPDMPALAKAAAEMLADQPRFRKAARRRAEEAFGLEGMIDKYLDALLK